MISPLGSQSQVISLLGSQGQVIIPLTNDPTKLGLFSGRPTPSYSAVG